MTLRAPQVALSLLAVLLIAAGAAIAAVERPAHPAIARVERDAAPAPERIEVTALGDPDATAAWLRSLGARIEVRSGARIQALVTPRIADRLRGATTRVRVEPPAVLVPLQTAPEAVVLVGADRWHAAGFTGHGVQIAVLDAGFLGYRGALGRTLPASVATRALGTAGVEGTTDHGLRAAELAHRVAPGARLHLVSFGTVTELSAAVDYAIAEQVDVISFSLGFIHNGPGDGTGPVNAIVSRAVDAGITWSVAAGNWAQQHWRGPFVDSDGDSIHEFAGDATQNRHHFQAGDLIVVSLRWDDAWGESCSDYDLELFGPDGSLVRASRRIQNCAGDPVESLQVLATQTGRYGVRVVQAQGERPHLLDLMVVGSPDRGAALDQFVPAGSLSEPADHPGVVTVGAAGTASPPGQTAFSSRGPTADGRAKPTVIAPSGVQAGATRVFAGTSAAAPHVAGMLALLQEALPAAGVLELRGQLIARSTFGRTTDPTGTLPLVAAMGSLSGLGTLLPVGADEARLLGEIPATAGGLGLVSYLGPDGYPLRFAHLLTGGRDLAAAFRFVPRSGRFERHVAGAPAWVNEFDRLSSGDILVIRVAPEATGTAAVGAARGRATPIPR